MTPLHDVLSMWPYCGGGANQFRPRKADLAMAVISRSAHHLFHTVQARRWRQLASKHGGDAVWAAMVELLTRVDGVLARVERSQPRSPEGAHGNDDAKRKRRPPGVAVLAGPLTRKDRDLVARAPSKDARQPAKTCLIS